MPSNFWGPVGKWARGLVGAFIQGGATTITVMIVDPQTFNIADGLGFVYNAGERVLGTTTPFFTLLLALFSFRCLIWASTSGEGRSQHLRF